MRTAVTLICFTLVLLSSSAAGAQHQHTAPPPKPATLMKGLGTYHRPISTGIPAAQQFFDQGLNLVYAFNHDEAVRSFQRATQLDPKAAMPHWGIAYALGPNINDPDYKARMQQAYEAVQQARRLAEGGSSSERALVEALALRYTTDASADPMKLQVAYKNAMADLAKRLPDDPDVATFYAESLMNLRPWQFWTADGKAAEGTEELVQVLERVLRRYPNHPGANHFYIHAVEASPSPERALPSAARLESLVPAAGHLVHMPAHVYIRTGDYAAAARVNEVAARADEAYFAASGGSGGPYSMMYYNHNLHFLSAAAAMEGRYTAAMSAANRLVKHVGPSLKTTQMLDFFAATQAFVSLRFGRWQDAAKYSAPGTSPVLRLFEAFTRAIGHAALGAVPPAKAEAARFEAAALEIGPDVMLGLNPAGNVVKVARAVLQARLAAAAKDMEAAIAAWKEAVSLQDALNYDEPPDWYYPVRESLGAALMQAGRHAEAETVFRADLDINARNARSLFGLMEALRAQKRDGEAALVEREFKAAWKNAEPTVKLRLSDF